MYNMCIIEYNIYIIKKIEQCILLGSMWYFDCYSSGSQIKFYHTMWKTNPTTVAFTAKHCTDALRP